MKKLLYIVENILGLYRWHPKIALRYLPVVDEIKKLETKVDVLDILEVGSAGLGIAPYLKRQVTGLDTSFQPPFHHLLVPVKGTGAAIPFTNNSFNTVVSVDMLEHVPQIERAKVISEMVRVAKRLVCIGVPCGVAAHAQDEELKELLKKRHGVTFGYLEEQVEYGVPSKEEILSLIKTAAVHWEKKVQIKSTGNINLGLRKWLMLGWMSSNVLTNIFFRKILLVFLPLMRYLNQELTYRQLFFVTINQ